MEKISTEKLMTRLETMATTALVPSSTMSTMTMTMGSPSHFSHMSRKKESRQEATYKMQGNLVRYSRKGDKGMLLQTLKDFKFLSCLEIDPAQPADSTMRDMEKEVMQQTTVEVNGTPFLEVGGGAKGGRECLTMLKLLCEELCRGKHVRVSSRTVYKQLIAKMAPSTASADPYFHLNSLLGSPDLLVMPLSTENQITPIQLTIFESGGHVHMRMVETFRFGLFRKSDVKSLRPWIIVEAVVTERCNLSKAKSSRFLTLKTPDN